MKFHIKTSLGDSKVEDPGFTLITDKYGYDPAVGYIDEIIMDEMWDGDWKDGVIPVGTIISIERTE